MTAPLRVLVADDEPLARAGLREMLAANPAVVVVGEASDGRDALRLAGALRPDVVFLDIQMPEADGLEIAATFSGRTTPAVVFVTAYEEYALSAFEIDAVDYLLKPFDDVRLARSLRRVRQFLGAVPDASGLASTREAEWRARHHRFVVKDRGTIVFVEPDDIDWVESWGNYVRLRVGGRALLLRDSMASVSARLDPSSFLRISRGVIVNAARVRRLAPKPNGQVDLLLDNSLVLTASRRHREALLGFFRSG
jgi:two-component system LytT family response regulator